MLIRSSAYFLHNISSLYRHSMSNTSGRALHTSLATYPKLYSRKHEWVEVLDDTDNVKVGITEYAAEALGDVVFAQLPAVGEEVSKGSECGAVESVKAASDLYTPVSGTVINTNQQLENKPALINTSPEEEAWMFELKLANRIELRSLMDKDGYDNFLKSVTDDMQ